MVIPARDAAETIGETIRSLAPAARHLARIIVVDDRSSDATPALAAEAAEAIGVAFLMVPGSGRGPGVARNLGVGQATQTFVYFLDADDACLAEGLLSLRRVLSENANADIAVGACLDDGPAGWRRHDPPELSSSGVRLAERLLAFEAPLIRMGSALIRRSALEGVAFPTGCPIAEDGVFWAALLARRRAVTIREPVMVYRLDSARYDARYLAAPRRSYLGFARAARRLAGAGLGPSALRRARGAMAALHLERLARTSREDVSRSLLRAFAASRPSLRKLLRTARSLSRSKRLDLALRLLARAALGRLKRGRHAERLSPTGPAP